MEVWHQIGCILENNIYYLSSSPTFQVKSSIFVSVKTFEDLAEVVTWFQQESFFDDISDFFLAQFEVKVFIELIIELAEVFSSQIIGGLFFFSNMGFILSLGYSTVFYKTIKVIKNNDAV